MSSTMPEIASLYRYPVKGLSPEALTRIRVEAGETLPFDRAWAIENGRSKFDPASPKHLPKVAFLMLMRNERLASLETVFDESARSLTVRRDGKAVAQGSLDTEDGRAALEAFFDAYEADELRGPTRIVSAPGHAFTDTPAKCLSLINLETLRDIEGVVGATLHPLRFRANIYIDGLPAWTEFDWLGKTVSAGEVTFEPFSRIDRCAATDVNPLTARRDLALPRTLLETYGRPDCGIYMRVVKGGELAAGALIAAA
jgi:uncharacterized protein YcbX